MAKTVDHLRCKNCEREFHLISNDLDQTGCVSCGCLDLELVEVYFVEKV
jgi:hypothetical protein